MQVQLGRIDWGNLFVIFSQISVYSIFIPLFIGIYRRNSLGRSLKIVLVFLFVATLFEQVSSHLGNFGIRNIFLVPIYVFIEFIFIVAIFKTVLKSDFWNKLLIYALIAFVIMFVSNLILFKETDDMGSYIRSIESLFIIAFIVVYYYQLIENLTISSVGSEPMFWVSAGFLIYFAGNLFLFVTSNYLLKQSEQHLMEAYTIHSILIIIRNLLFSVGLWMQPRT